MGDSLSIRKIKNVTKIFKGGEIDEKDCVDLFIVDFDYGVGRMSMVASSRWPWWWSWRWPWWRPLREGKMRELEYSVIDAFLNSQEYAN